MGKKWGRHPVWLGVRLSAEDGSALAVLARAQGRPSSALVREAIAAYLAAQRQEQALPGGTVRK